MPNAAMRALLGFVAAVISVLTFHQAMWEVLHLADFRGLAMPAPFPVNPVIPYAVPRIVNFCFWAGLWGAVFGVAAPRLRVPAWFCGLGMGIFGALLGLLLVPAVKYFQPGAGWLGLKHYTTMLTILFTYGLPLGAGSFSPMTWIRSLLVNGAWGLGVGIILPLIMPRAWRRA